MLLAAAVLVLGQALPAQAPGVEPPVRTADTVVIGLDELLRTAMAQNLRLRAASAETRGAESFRGASRSRFDPIVNIGGESGGSGVGGQLVGLLPTGGTYLLGSVAPSTLPGEPIYPNAIVASINQPVLRGLGLYSARSAIRAADAGVEASRARLSRTHDEVTAVIGLAYAALVERHRQEAIAGRSVRRAEELLDAYTSLRAIEKITEVDLITAKLGVASRQAALLALRRERRDAEDALVFAVYGAGAGTVLARGDVVWVPRDTAVIAPALPTLDDATARALAARPDLTAARQDAAQARYRSQYARNAALPTLNVSAAFSSTRTDTLPGAAVAFDSRFQEWRFGFVLSRPLVNAGSAAERDRNTAAVSQAEAALADAENVVRAEMRAAFRDIELGREQAAIAAGASRLAGQQYEKERERLTLGLTDIFRVLQYEEQVARVERAEAEAWLAYATSVVQYRLATGEGRAGSTP